MSTKSILRTMIVFLSPKFCKLLLHEVIEAFVFLFEKYLWEADEMINFVAILGE